MFIKFLAHLGHICRDPYVYIILVTATSPETRACPYNGKFEVSNLIRSEHALQADRGYFDNYYVNSGRIKRLDQGLECDNQGFTSLIIGCNSIDTMEFRAQCSSPDIITCKFLLRQTGEKIFWCFFKNKYVDFVFII